MWRWFVIIASGICSSLSVYMSLLAFKAGDSGGFLFAGFGLLAGAFFVVAVMRIAAEKDKPRKEIDRDTFRSSKPVSFVPHWFLMLALIVGVIAVLAAVSIPLFLR